MGPASMEVWISSPVRSRNPVLIKMTRSEAARIHSLRLTVVRRSSSMMPIFIVPGVMFSNCSVRSKSSTQNATSSGPCIFGLTTYIAPLRELRLAGSLRSCRAISAVITASIMPSNTSFPSPSRIAGLVIKWPTFRTSMRARPGSTRLEPSGAEYSRSGLRHRSKVSSPLETIVDRVPRISPNQLAYTCVLSAPSTAATESSQS